MPSERGVLGRMSMEQHAAVIEAMADAQDGRDVLAEAVRHVLLRGKLGKQSERRLRAALEESKAPAKGQWPSPTPRLAASLARAATEDTGQNGAGLIS